MDEADAALVDILADCASDDDLQRYIIKHATIVQRLACCMVKGVDLTEARIRTLYADFADMAVEHIGDSRIFPGRKLQDRPRVRSDISAVGEEPCRWRLQDRL